MEIQKQVILLFLIIVVEFHCEEAVIGNEGLALPKENEDVQEIVQNELNLPLLSEINDSDLPENPFAVKEKRCPKFRLGSPLTSNNDENNKNHKLYGAFCKTCIIRNKCDSISECPLCEKWCTSTSKLCSETDADGDTKLIEDKQPKDETVSLANRGNFINDEVKSEDSVNTVTLNKGNLMEIILSLLGIYDAKDVENVTISIKTKEGKPIVLNNVENSLKDEREEKLAENLKHICAISKKFQEDEDRNLSHEKLHELVQELLGKLRSPIASANDASPAVGSPNNVPEVNSRLKDAELAEKILHQSLMNPDLIEDTPDMSQMRDQRIRTPSDLLGNPTEEQAQSKLDEHVPIQHQNIDRSFESRLASDNLGKQQINGEFITPSGNPGLRKNYEPLNSKDFIDIKDQNVGTSFTRNKILDNNDFEEDAEEVQRPLMGAASAARPLLAKIRNINLDLKPQEVMDRLQAQHSRNSELFNKQNADTNFRGEDQNVGKVSDVFTPNKNIDHNHVEDVEEVQEVAIGAASAAKQFSQFNEEEQLGEPINFLHHNHLHHNPLHHNPIKHISHHPVPHNLIPHHSKFLHHHRSSETDDPFESDGFQQYDVRQLVKNSDNELNSRFNSQQYDRPIGEPFYGRDNPINSRFALQQHDSSVGQPFDIRKNEFNNGLVPQQYNIIGEPFNNRENQLNSRFTSDQIDRPVGQPINRNNQFDSGFAPQQYNIPVGQRFNNRDAQSNHHMFPFQQFDNAHDQLINRNSQLNSRFVPQLYDRSANVQSDHFSPHNSGFSPEHENFHLSNPKVSSRVASSRKSFPTNADIADAGKMALRAPSSEDDSLFFHKNEGHNKIGTLSAHSQFLESSKDPQPFEGLRSNTNIDNKHSDKQERTNEDKENDEVSMSNADLERISSDTDNIIENDSQLKQNHLGIRASELMKKLKDRQDQTMQRLENQKQQLEKARENVLGMVKTIDDVKIFDEDKKTNPSKTIEGSKLQSTHENIPKINQATVANTFPKLQTVLDKNKELSNSQKQFNTNDLPHLLNRNNDDIVGSQPLENSFERMAPDNVPHSRSFSNPRHGSIKQTLPEENPLEALNPENFNRDSQVGMPTPDVDSRGKFEDSQSNSNSLGKIIPAEKNADISFKKPSEVYFVGNGIKLPLQMVTKSDGSVHFSVDIDKLCSCNNTSCPKNHTAKELEQTVEAILEKEAELNKELEDFGDVPLGLAAPAFEKERNQREAVKKNNFINLKNRIANKFFNSVEDERNSFRLKRSIDENMVESNEEVSEKESLSPFITRVMGKGFKNIKKAISNIPKNTQLITTRLLLPDNRSNIMQPTSNIFGSKTLKDKHENVIPISKMYKFKGLEDQLAKKIENIEKTVDNYSKIDDQIFENESDVLNKFNEDPIIQKEVGLASDVLGFFKKLAVDSTKHKNF